MLCLACRLADRTNEMHKVLVKELQHHIYLKDVGRGGQPGAGAEAVLLLLPVPRGAAELVALSFPFRHWLVLML
jgi:hypothetical protein